MSSSGPFSPLGSLGVKSSPVGPPGGMAVVSGPSVTGCSGSGVAVAGGYAPAPGRCRGAVRTAGGRFLGQPRMKTNAKSTRGRVWRFMEPRFAMARRGSRAPVRLDVVAGSRAQRVDGAALPVGDGDLPGVAALAGEDEVAAIGSPRGILAAPAAGGDLTDLPGGQVDDSDVEADRSAGLEARGVGDLAVLLRRVPGGGVVPVAHRRQPPDVETLAVHEVDLGRARAVRRERDLLPGGAPGGCGVAPVARRDAVCARAVRVRDPDLQVPGLVAGVREALAIGGEGRREGLAFVLGDVVATAFEDAGDEDGRAPLAVRGVGEGAAVRAPGGQDVERVVDGDPLRVEAVVVDDVQLLAARGLGGVTVGGEPDLPS